MKMRRRRGGGDEAEFGGKGELGEEAEGDVDELRRLVLMREFVPALQRVQEWLGAREGDGAAGTCAVVDVCGDRVRLATGPAGGHCDGRGTEKETEDVVVVLAANALAEVWAQQPRQQRQGAESMEREVAESTEAVVQRWVGEQGVGVEAYMEWMLYRLSKCEWGPVQARLGLLLDEWASTLQQQPQHVHHEEQERYVEAAGVLIAHVFTSIHRLSASPKSAQELLTGARGWIKSNAVLTVAQRKALMDVVRTNACAYESALATEALARQQSCNPQDAPTPHVLRTRTSDDLDPHSRSAVASPAHEWLSWDNAVYAGAGAAVAVVAVAATARYVYVHRQSISDILSKWWRPPPS